MLGRLWLVVICKPRCGTRAGVDQAEIGIKLTHVRPRFQKLLSKSNGGRNFILCELTKPVHAMLKGVTSCYSQYTDGGTVFVNQPLRSVLQHRICLLREVERQPSWLHDFSKSMTRHGQHSQQWPWVCCCSAVVNTVLYAARALCCCCITI